MLLIVVLGTIPLSRKFSNPSTNSSLVSSSVFLLLPPVEAICENSNSSKSSTLDLK